MSGTSLIQYSDITYPVQGRCIYFNNGVPLHWHTYYEVELLTDGEAQHLINGQQYIVSRGAVSIMTPRDFHRYQTDTGFTIKKFIFREGVLTPEATKLLLERSSPCLAEVSGGLFAELEGLFDQVIDGFRDTDPLAMLLLRSTVERICVLILQNADIISESKHTGGHTELLNAALVYIGEHFNERITLEETAASVHLSAGHFSRLFSRMLGKSFSEYVKLKRIQYASTLLLSTGMPIDEIAWQEGFPSTTFFNRAFKAQYQLSPMDYRRTFRT